MGIIIYFEENGKSKSVIRFVRGYRNKGWFRKERIEYSLTVSNCCLFLDNEKVVFKVCERIKKDFPEAKIYCTESSAFYRKYENHEFYVITKCDNGYNDRESYANDSGHSYYSGMANGDIHWTTDLNDTEIYFDYESASEAVNHIRKKGGKVFAKTVFLNLINGLMEPCFMITCTSKRGKEETKYFSHLEGNRLRLVSTSANAKKFTYREVLETFEYLKTKNKNFLYVVMPVFKENVNCKNLESYIKENKISRMVQMTTKLRWLNR